MNNDSGNINSECMDQVKLNKIILVEDDESSSQEKCCEKKIICNSESVIYENNQKMDDTCDGKVTNELIEIIPEVESPKNTYESQPARMDIRMPNNIWKQPSLNDDDQKDSEDNEELSSFFGQTQTIKHEIECCCQTCTIQRAFVRDKIKRTWNWQSQGFKLREYIRGVFNAAIECPCVPNIPKYEFDPIQYELLQQIVDELVTNHPHKFFLMLAIQAQEFVVELKIRIMQPFENNSDIDQIAEIFLTRLLNGYDMLINTAAQVTELIKLLEEKHLNKFNLRWEFFNKKLYQNYIYFYEPIIRNILPFIMRQLRKSCKKSNDGYKLLLERYLHFVDEMMKTARLWPEKELMIDKYNSEQISHIINKRKNNPDGWTIWTIEEALKVENERTMDVPGLGLSQTTLDCYFVKQLNELETTIFDNTEFVRRTLDTWARQAYQTLAANYLGIHWFEDEENLKNESLSVNNRNLAYYFGYQSGACLVLNCPNDNNVKIETNCSVCGDLTWVSHLVINGRTKAGSCAHPALQPNDEKTNENFNLPTTNEKQYKRCICMYRHLGEWQMATFQGLLLFPPCLCMLNIRQFAVTTFSEGAANSTCLCIRNDITPIKKSNNQLITQTSLPKEQPSSDLKTLSGTKVTSTSTQTQHSAVQTLTVPHNCNDHNNHHNRSLTNGLSSKDATKTTGSFSKIRNLKKNHNNNNNSNNNNNNTNNSNNTSSYNCLSKRANIEQIRRVSCNSVDGNYSDSASIEDSCSSADSLTPRENGRHCDCCYCEVFGHGVPSVASVGRNYNETRERLRQLLTKKKAKTCSTSVCNSPPIPIESITVSNSNSCTSDTSNTNLISNNPEPKSNTPVQQSANTIDQSQKQDNRDLNVLLDFIEGNQQAMNCKKDINIKKSEKKARQKQKKFEKNLKMQQEELDRKKLVELQKKTPGVTITVVDPQKPISQKLLLNRNLPEVSILPATLSHQQKHINNIDNSRNGFSRNNNSNNNIGGNNSNSSNSICNSNSSSISKNNNNNVKQRMANSRDMPGDKKGTLVIGINEILNSSHSAKSIKDREKLNDINKSIILNSKNKKSPESILLESQSQLSLTKKQRKKLRREMRKMEEAKIQEQKKHEEVENQPQIVTIKRVMESNSAEPTVTITLKGQTPAEDKVLFTLINGQTKEPIQEQQLPQNPTGKKKKKKKKNQDANSQTTQQQTNQMPINQQNVIKSKNQPMRGNDKILKDQLNNGKNKIIEQENSQKIFLTITKELTQNNADNKSKKNKKNVENKQPLTSLQQKNSTKGKNQQHGPVENEKRQKKANTTGQPLAEIKIQSNVNNLTNNVSNKKKNKALEQQNSNNNNYNTDNKKNSQSEKSSNKNNNKQQTVKVDSSSITQLKTTIAQQSISKLLRTNIQHNKVSEQNSNSLSSQLKDASSKINIENLRLPPGITITKVDAPVKPLPIKSTPLQKQPMNSSKQATIIAAPMSTNSMQPNYSSSGSQSPGNVIVVDTGKLKQDLLPNSEKGASKDQNNTAGNGKKKKKKKKNSNNTNNTNNNNSASGNNKPGVILMSKKNNDLTSKYACNDQARIVHNPGSNMVTIRNPAFGSVPKMEPLQQAAIIKLSENGMVTIRSPALQQAINAGLTPPPKPDFIVKGDFVTGNNAANSKTPTAQSNHIAGQKCTNNGFITSNLSELRNKLTTPKCGNLSGFGNIQISKVTNGQSIPENGINLKGTSVTLTKINSPETVVMSTKINDNQQSTGSKTKKKKKKSSGTKTCGDDWNLVESVFTPKDIDLEDGEMDDAERELEAFKRFCLQSVPPPRKEKVNLNIKDIVLKKKSSSTAAAAAIIAAN